MNSSGDSTGVISRSANRFFVGTLLSRATGMFRDMAMAFAFGTSSAVASFMMALRFAHLLRRILGEGTLQPAFAPLFEELRKNSPSDACHFFRDLSATLTVILTAIIALSMSVLGAIIVYSDVTANNKEVLLLTILMLPSLLFICSFSINTLLLQCERSFLTPSIAPVAFNVIWIAGALSLRNYHASIAMPYLSIAIILACLGQWLVTLPRTLSFYRAHTTEALWQGCRIFSQQVRRLGKPLALGILGVTASQINSAIDTIFARSADAEGPALLWYAIRIQQVPIGLFGVALSGALLPPLSRAIKQGQSQEFTQFFRFALQRNTTIMLPFTLALILLGAPGINLVFGRGLFSDASTTGTTWCLWGYAIGLLPMTLVLVIAPTYYARENYIVPMTASVVSVIVNIILNAIMIFYCGWGPASVAVATSLSAWINVAILTYGLRKHGGVTSFYDAIRGTRRLATATLWATMMTVVIATLLFKEPTLGLITGQEIVHFPRYFLEQLSYFFLPAGCFVGMLFLLTKKEDFYVV